MRTAEFTGGGSLDGGVRQVPAGVESVVTTERDGITSSYVLDDAGTFVFTGFNVNDQGEAMSGIVRALRRAARAGQEAADESMKPRGCARCGGVYGSRAAYVIHFEAGEGSACLPGDARGQLVDVAGVLVTPWSDAARNVGGTA